MAKKIATDAKKNFIKFLGTAGARFVMIKQLRSSGGLWLCYEGTNVLIDPGPGSIVRCAKALPKLDPGKLDAIILTHRHLDHAGDINVMIEAMTEGGFKKRGTVFAPADAINEDTVILKHVQPFPEKIITLQEKKTYKAGEFEFQTSMRHIHPVETYGLKFKFKDTVITLLSDTKYFPQLTKFYKSDILIMAIVFFEPRPGVSHLSLEDAKLLIKELKPKKTILTHFGMTMLTHKPHIIALELSQETGLEVLSAYDGMTLNFP